MKTETTLLKCQFCEKVKIDGKWLLPKGLHMREKRQIVENGTHTNGTICDKCNNKRTGNHYLW